MSTRSLKEILEQSCKKFGDLPAYGNMGVSITYRELDQASRDFGAFLQKVVGLSKGDRVAIMLPNLLQYPVALFGTLRAGMTVVNTNPMYTARELQHQLNDSGATAIVVLENFAHTLEEVLPANGDQNGHHDADRRPVSSGEGVHHQSRGQAREEDGAAVANSERNRLQVRAAARTRGNAGRRAAEP